MNYVGSKKQPVLALGEAGQRGAGKTVRALVGSNEDGVFENDLH
jgi:hypothetical protein